jgi:hypothetical protein
MRFADEFLGPEFYKLGYVTKDRDRAIERLAGDLGIEEFVPFEPTFVGTTVDGRQGSARLRCAFSAGRHHTVEVLEPVEGLVDLWADPLKGASNDDLVFHHFGLVTDRVESVRDEARRRGHTVAMEARVEGAFHFVYLDPPALPHLTEHIQYFGDADGFLRSVRERPL